MCWLNLPRWAKPRPAAKACRIKGANGSGGGFFHFHGPTSKFRTWVNRMLLVLLMLCTSWLRFSGRSKPPPPVAGRAGLRLPTGPVGIVVSVYGIGQLLTSASCNMMDVEAMCAEMC